MNHRLMLTIAGYLSMGVAAFHVVLTFSADLCEFFGSGPKIAEMLRAQDPQVYLLMVFMIAVFALFGLYGLSGAGRFRRLPLLKTGLFVIGAIYTLRGLLLFPEILGVIGVIAADIPLQNVFSSATSLTIGLCYLTGTIGLLRQRA